MKELVEKLNEQLEEFKMNAEKAVGGNKAAAARARKNSLALEKLMKEFRKVSIQAK